MRSMSWLNISSDRKSKASSVKRKNKDVLLLKSLPQSRIRPIQDGAETMAIFLTLLCGRAPRGPAFDIARRINQGPPRRDGPCYHLVPLSRTNASVRRQVSSQTACFANRLLYSFPTMFYACVLTTLTFDAGVTRIAIGKMADASATV